MWYIYEQNFSFIHLKMTSFFYTGALSSSNSFQVIFGVGGWHSLHIQQKHCKNLKKRVITTHFKITFTNKII